MRMHRTLPMCQNSTAAINSSNRFWSRSAQCVQSFNHPQALEEAVVLYQHCMEAWQKCSEELEAITSRK